MTSKPLLEVKKMKRLYVVSHRDDSECGAAFVAESVSEAKKMAMREDIADSWVDLRVKTYKADVSTWAKGMPDYKRCLRAGFFGYIIDDCDICKAENTLACVTKDGKCVCDDCYEKEAAL